MKPVIKWSGSKRSQASKIVSHFCKFETYYEPFIGGGSVLYQVNPIKAIAGDINKPLIELWNHIKYNPEKISEEYQIRWIKLQEEGYKYYYYVRDRFNKEFSPFDLLFLSRTCVNGLIRYNKDGEFNNSFHHSRSGINPDTLDKIIFDWSVRIQGTEFIHGDYRMVTNSADKNDLVYLDPPYFGTKGRYFGTIDYNEFIEYLYDLKSRDVRYILSYDGKRGEKDYIKGIPKDLYERHLLLESGNSTFRKVIDKKVEKVIESLYISY